MMNVFEILWRVRWWSDDGHHHDEDGVEEVEAAEQDEAEGIFLRQRRSGHHWWERPHRLICGDRLSQTHYWHLPDYPAALPDRHVLRGRIFNGTTPQALRDEFISNGTTPLEVLIAFAKIFMCWLDQLDDLDKRLKDPKWRHAHQIRRAFVSGDDIVDVLHTLYPESFGAMELSYSFRDALDLDLSDVKILFDLACNRDPRFERALTRSLTTPAGTPNRGRFHRLLDDEPTSK